MFLTSGKWLEDTLLEGALFVTTTVELVSWCSYGLTVFLDILQVLVELFVFFLIQGIELLGLRNVVGGVYILQLLVSIVLICFLNAGLDFFLHSLSRFWVTRLLRLSQFYSMSTFQ